MAWRGGGPAWAASGLGAAGLAADRAAGAAAAALLGGHVAHRGHPAEVAAALGLDDDRLAEPERSLAVSAQRK